VRRAPWVLVLAAGEGKRVRSLTRDRLGQPAPKQFTAAGGDSTLLETTLLRAQRIAPPERIVTIVAAEHERWWRSELAGFDAENIIVQPLNRGTATGILVPLFWITRRDRNATVIILPSDHFVESEETLAGTLTRAVSSVTRSEAPIVLLGTEADNPEEDYGWIMPCPGPANCPHQVAAFREKPDACSAASLLNQGALLNTFIIVADGRSLLALFKERTPQLWSMSEEALADLTRGSFQQADLTHFYRSIPTMDFSRDVLETAADKLWVCSVPSCGWSDLGTAQRLNDHLLRQCGHSVMIKPEERPVAARGQG
jgi:mannose-1-phosphate guanylyltransferase